MQFSIHDQMNPRPLPYQAAISPAREAYGEANETTQRGLEHVRARIEGVHSAVFGSSGVKGMKGTDELIVQRAPEPEEPLRTVPYGPARPVRTGVYSFNAPNGLYELQVPEVVNNRDSLQEGVMTYDDIKAACDKVCGFWYR